MARLPTGRILVLQFVYPVAAVLVDWAVYGKTLSVSQILGVAVMGLALGGAPSRSRDRPTHRHLRAIAENRCPGFREPRA